MFYKLLGLEETHYNFKDLAGSFKNHGILYLTNNCIVDAVIWKDILKSEDPHLIPLPEAYEHRLTPF